MSKTNQDNIITNPNTGGKVLGSPEKTTSADSNSGKDKKPNKIGRADGATRPDSGKLLVE